MNASSSSAIRNLQYNRREIESKNRKRLGFHVYLSRFFYDFYYLSLPEQHKYIFRTIGVRLGFLRTTLAEDDRSVDSTDSVLKENVKMHDIMRAACFRWKFILTLESKNAWKKRAKKLNNRKLPGKYIRLPDEMQESNGCTNTLEKNVLESLSMEYDTLVCFFRNCITRQPKLLLSSRTYKFGDESVLVGTQTYRDFKLSHLLSISLFGNNYSNFNSCEVIMKTKNQILVHIGSQERMSDLFTKEELKGAEFLAKEKNFEFFKSC